MINDRQANELTSKGDCREHHHLEDRVTLAQLQERMRVRAVTGTASLLPTDDIVTVASASTLTLPGARAQQEIEIIQQFDGLLTILPHAGDTIMQDTSLLSYVSGTALHLKALSTDWVLI